MENETVVYKRRPRKPLSDLPANAADVEDDPSSRLSSVGFDQNGRTKCLSARLDTRKSWIDRSLSTKGRRSSVSWGEEFNLPEMASKWVGTLFRKQVKCGEENLRNEPIKKPVNRNRKVNPPAEFMKEKQVMFAEVDTFELESEEESPAFARRPQQWTKENLNVAQEVLNRRRGLDIVPEDEFEECGDLLSAILLSLEESSQSSSLQSASSESSSQSWSSTLRSSLSDSEDYSSPAASFGVDEPPLNHYLTGTKISSVRSDLLVNFEESVPPPKADKKRSSLDDCSVLVSELTSLRIGQNVGQNLNTVLEDEHLKVIESEIFSQGRKISLETSAEETLPILKALLEECHQARPLSLRDAISDFCDLSEMVKLGEGTFGEAFKGGRCVFKIVPMDGDFLVNAEVQKTSAEIYSEVLLTNTLNRLRGLDSQDSMNCANYCTNFIETKAIRICQGSYEVELCRAWEEWDAVRTSDNDHPMLFPQHQLYVLFVLADGGKDLETFVLSDFNEARSLLLQVVLALAVAEDGCGFEHRDLHWGNIVLARDEEFTSGYYRLCDEDLEVKTLGLSVSIIDFTLSRIDTGKHVFFCNLSADPALFEGPSRDAQADTYRRMLSITKGNWEGSFPQTNCLWIHYVADVLVSKKSYQCSSQQIRALRSFCKRVLLYESAKAAVSDEFFQDMWIKRFEQPCLTGKS
ncbi:unnamed protein product [Calypogeia fissa]